MKTLAAAIFDLDGLATEAPPPALVEALRAEGVRTGVVLRSHRARARVDATETARLFDARIDDADLEEQGMPASPDLDRLVKCAEALGVAPGHTVVVEPSVAGVRAGRSGGFGLVVAVERGEPAAELERAGADVVVRDLAELDPERLEASFEARQAEISWYVEEEGFDPTREHTMESLFVVGNGYLGVRGSLDTPLLASEADLFVAGIYDRKFEHLPYSEVEFLSPERGGSRYAQLVRSRSRSRFGYRSRAKRSTSAARIGASSHGGSIFAAVSSTWTCASRPRATAARRYGRAAAPR